MQDEDERRPDLADDDYEATAQRVDKLMQDAGNEPAFKTTKSSKSKQADTTTAPEIPDLPVPKEPLTIKIIKDEPEQAEPEDNESSPQEEETPEKAQTEEVEPTPETEPDDSELPPAEDTESSKEQPTEKPAEDFDDRKTVDAVDDIVAKESDAILEAEDEKVAKAFNEPKKDSLWHRFLGGWKNYWAEPKRRWITLSVLLVLFMAAWIVPLSRYFMLNTFGARAKLSVRVMDQSTKQPLKNVHVSAGGATTTSDQDGFARLEKVKLGPTTLSIERVAFAPVNNKVTVGWGSNPQGEVDLTPVGVQYSFVAVDYLTGKPIEKVEAVSGEASAFSDAEGKIKLTVEKPSSDTLDVALKGDGLREEKLQISTETKDTATVQMVPGRKQVFVSKRDGNYDTYSIDIDGKNEQKILAGTGSERDDIAIISHPSEEMVAVVSTRDNKRNKDGFLLSTLTIIDLKNNTPTKVTDSERVQVIGWVGDRLVYVQVAAGTSAANPKRHRLLSYDYKNNQTDEIAAANYFNDVMLVGGKIYYAPSSTYQPNAANSKLYKVDADGSNRQTVLDKETWNVFRTGYDKLALSVGNEWYDYQLGGGQPTKLAGPPANVNSRVYVDSPDGKTSIWVDNRDGKGVLLSFLPSSKNELILRQQSGLKTPIRWLSNNVVVFRINTEQETADYALSLNGGDARKIRDVTNTNSSDTWYYY